jgi:hypothetical protein
MTEERLLKAGDVGVMLSVSKRQVHRLNSTGRTSGASDVCGRLPRPIMKRTAE